MRWSPWFALLLYFGVSLGTVRDVGVVGEVAAGWSGVAPRVAVDLEGGRPTWSGPPETPHAGHAAGPFVSAQTRPLERLRLGETSLPIALNTYTGGVPDWPAWLLYQIHPLPGGVVAWNLLLGAGLILLAHCWVTRAGAPVAGLVAACVLATDWSFVYYRKVLGGTEIALQFAALWFVVAWFSRRRGEGRQEGARGLAAGLGMVAKVTFVAAVVASAVAVRCVPRGVDRLPVRRTRWIGPVAFLVVVSPLVLASLHRAVGLPADPLIRSHDDLGLQAARLLDGWSTLFAGRAPAREGFANLFWFLLEPIGWFRDAYGAQAAGWGGAIARGMGWVFVLLGSWRCWRTRTPGPVDLLLRVVSVQTLVQGTLLWLFNRDLHHLAQVTPFLALWIGLAAARLHAEPGPRGLLRRLVPIVVAGSFMGAGFRSLLLTDTVLASLRAPTFTEHGQAALVDLLRQHGVQRLWTSDYDLYGVFEVRAPELDVAHAWGAVSRAADRGALTRQILMVARGGHWLLVRPSAPMIYNHHPRPADVVREGAAGGLLVTEEGRLEDAFGPWAWLLRVESSPPGRL